MSAIGNIALGSRIGRHLETVKIDRALCPQAKAELRRYMAELNERVAVAMDAPEPPPPPRPCHD